MNQDTDPLRHEANEALRKRLLNFLTSLELNLDEEATEETPLVGSGLLDSMGLLQLAAWIEGEIGHPIDPGSFDLQEEWKTVGTVLECIRRHRDA